MSPYLHLAETVQMAAQVLSKSKMVKPAFETQFTLRHFFAFGNRGREGYISAQRRMRPAVQTYQDFQVCAAARFAPAPLWRAVLGLVVVAGVFILASTVAIALVALAGPHGIDGFAEIAAGEMSRGVILGYLGAFLAVHLILALLARPLHKVRFADFWGEAPAIRLAGFLRGGLVVVLVLGVLLVLAALVWPPVRALGLAEWAPFALLTLPVLLVQTSAEELLFRGYLQHLFAARFRAAWIWILLPSLIFGSLHYDSGSFGPNAWLVVVAATLMGIIAADVTARTGNISAACGLHFANNTISLLFVATPGPLDKLALFRDNIDPANYEAMRLSLLANIAILLLAFAIWRGWLRRNG